MKKQRGNSYSQLEREDILAAYHSSNLGVTQWCKEQGFNKGTLGTWLRRYRKTSQKPEKGITKFVPLEVAPCRPTSELSSLQVHYPNGVRLSLESEVDFKFLHRLIYLENNV